MEVPFTMQLIIYSCRLMTENLTDQQGAENVRSFVTPNLVSSPGTLHSPKAGVSKKKNLNLSHYQPKQQLKLLQWFPQMQKRLTSGGVHPSSCVMAQHQSFQLF